MSSAETTIDQGNRQNWTSGDKSMEWREGGGLDRRKNTACAWESRMALASESDAAAEGSGVPIAIVGRGQANC